jgi:hypothetical protein
MSAKLYKKAERINARNQRIQEMVAQGWGSESRLSMIQMLIPLGLQAVEQELLAEVRALAGGEKYGRSQTGIKRWGSNPGSVFVGDQKLKINVPRVRDVEEGREVQLRSYERLQNPAHLDEIALSRVINGISQGKYERAAEHVPRLPGPQPDNESRRTSCAEPRATSTPITATRLG